MCARAARQPWRSRDTASLTTAKNQKSRTGENERNVSANMQGYPTRGHHRKASPHGGRVRALMVARNAKKRKPRAYEERERPPGGGRSQTWRRRSYLTSTDAPASSSCDLI